MTTRIDTAIEAVKERAATYGMVAEVTRDERLYHIDVLRNGRPFAGWTCPVSWAGEVCDQWADRIDWWVGGKLGQ